jgi:hypothetical protein
MSGQGVKGTSDFSLITLGVLDTSVRVSGFSGDGVVLNVIESSVHKTTVASSIKSRAIDELLFREIDGIGGSTVNDKSRFKRTSGGESPAGTTRFLVLD